MLFFVLHCFQKRKCRWSIISRKWLFLSPLPPPFLVCPSADILRDDLMWFSLTHCWVLSTGQYSQGALELVHLLSLFDMKRPELEPQGPQRLERIDEGSAVCTGPSSLVLVDNQGLWTCPAPWPLFLLHSMWKQYPGSPFSSFHPLDWLKGLLSTGQDPLCSGRARTLSFLYSSGLSLVSFEAEVIQTRCQLQWHQGERAGDVWLLIWSGKERKRWFLFSKNFSEATRSCVTCAHTHTVTGIQWMFTCFFKKLITVKDILWRTMA